MDHITYGIKDAAREGEVALLAQIATIDTKYLPYVVAVLAMELTVASPMARAQ
jgi:hypothetical protein